MRPVLALALARLASSLRALVTPRPSDRGGFNHSRFILFDLLDATSQGFAKARATSIDLVQTGTTAALSDGDQPIDAFNYLEIPFQCVGNEVIYGCRCVGKKFVDQFHRLRLVSPVLFHNFIRSRLPRLVHDLIKSPGTLRMSQTVSIARSDCAHPFASSGVLFYGIPVICSVMVSQLLPETFFESEVSRSLLQKAPEHP